MLGYLVRRFDVSLTVIGVVLTCETVKKRYKYIDRETGYTPLIETVRRKKNETAKDFANRILSSRLLKDAA